MKTRTTTKTTTSWSLRPRQRPLLGAVVAFGFILGGCSSGDAAEPSATTTVHLPSQTTAAPYEAGSALRSALARYDGGYEFSSVVAVNESIAVEVDGRNVSGSSQMTITSGDGEVEYLIVGGSQWARTPEGEWDVVSEGEASQPPLQPLKAPTDVQIVDRTASSTTLKAFYPAAAFQLAGSDLEVVLTIEDGLLTSAHYTTAERGAVALVESTFRPLSDFTPITTP